MTFLTSFSFSLLFSHGIFIWVALMLSFSGKGSFMNALSQYECFQVERRRRDTINTWIMKLGKLIPDLFASSNDAEPNAPSRSSQMSKGGILAR